MDGFFLVFSYNEEEAGQLINGAESEMDVQTELTLFFFHTTHKNRYTDEKARRLLVATRVWRFGSNFVAPFSLFFHMLQGLGKDTRWKTSLHFLWSQLSRNCGYVAGKLYTLVSVYILILRLIGDIDRVVIIGLEYLIITTGYCCIVVSLLEFNVWACRYQNESVSEG